MSARSLGTVTTGERGVALAILVWFLAAMSLLVGSLMLQARVDIKLAQQHASKAKAQALADGAILLTMAQIGQLESRGEFYARNQHMFPQALGEETVWVEVTPLGGLVDINKVSEEMLFQLILGAGKIDENVARELAANMLEWRAPGENAENTVEDRRPARLEAIEDLLQIPGFDRDIYDALRDAIYVSQQGNAAIDWLSAPVSLLQSLGMSEEEAVEYAQRRIGEDGVSVGLPEAVDPAFFGAESLRGFRLDAFVIRDDVTFLRRKWVDRSRNAPDGLPWHFFRTEPVRSVVSVFPGETPGVVLQEGYDARN